MMHNIYVIKKALIFILLVFVVIASLVVIKLSATPAKPQLQNNGNWPVYSNDGFEINYPPEFNVKRISLGANGESIVFYKGSKIATDAALCNTTHLTININSGGLCGSLAYKDSTSQIKESSSELFGIEVKRFDDYVKDLSQLPVEVRFSDVSYNKNVITVSYFVHLDDYGDIEDLTRKFELMIKSLK